MAENFRSDEFDSELAEIMRAKKKENVDGVSLIASANHPNPEDYDSFTDAVKATFEGAYFEGYPSEKGPGQGRYYQGTDQADSLENLSRNRIIKVMGRNLTEEEQKSICANVQVPTGAGANISVFESLMNFGDKMVSPSLKDGYGHLSHGADSPNIVGKLFDVKGYGVNPDTGLLDYDKMEEIVRKHMPKIVLAGASSYPRDIDWKRVAEIADEVGAISMADISHPAGLIVADLLNDPVLAGIDVITSTTHKTLGGMKGAIIVWNKDSLAKKITEGSLATSKSDINAGVFPGSWGGPHMPTIAATASTFRRAQTEEFKEVQRKTQENAAVLAQALKDNGWNIVTGGTDNHLVLVDIVNSEVKNENTMDGWQAAIQLERVGIVSNKNSIPNGDLIRKADGSIKGTTAMRPAGLRFGLPPVTTRGCGVNEIQELAELIDAALRSTGDSVKLQSIRDEVKKMASRFPIPEYR